MPHEQRTKARLLRYGVRERKIVCPGMPATISTPASARTLVKSFAPVTFTPSPPNARLAGTAPESPCCCGSVNLTGRVAESGTDIRHDEGRLGHGGRLGQLYR